MREISVGTAVDAYGFSFAVGALKPQPLAGACSTAFHAGVPCAACDRAGFAKKRVAHFLFAQVHSHLGSSLD